MKQIETDVLVIGGGTAGIAAAIAAAEEGASIVLVERDGALGGIGIRAGIHYYYYGSLGGVQMKVDKKARDLQKKFGGKARGFHPEAKGLVIEQWIEELGITVLYYAVAADVIMDGTRLCGAIVESDTERIEITASVTIDSTGDGDIAWMAGADYTLGREWDGALHTYSMVPRHVDERNILHYKNYDVGWVDSTDVRDVSRAYRTGRQFAWRGEENPANTHYSAIGPQLGIREGRCIQGEYVLTQDDLLLDRRFDDVVMRCYSHHDTHTFDYANESDLTQVWIPILGKRMFPFGGDVPYRSLVPLKVEGLLIGCRAISQDHDCGMTLRMQRDMHKIGEIAGVAAAMSVNKSLSPREVNVAELQQRLIARGVLAQEDLTRSSVPWMKFKNEAGEDVGVCLEHGFKAEHVSEWIEYLGTEQEEAALWWLQQAGSIAVQPLLEALAGTTGRQQRGVAFALGLLGNSAAVPHLLATVRRRDADKPGDGLARSEERWVAALIVLRLLNDASAFEEVLQAMKSERESTIQLYLLHYLKQIAEQLNTEQRKLMVIAVETLLKDPSLGDDFIVQGSGDAMATNSNASSMKWGLELTAAFVLEQVGGKGGMILERYAQDERGYARLAAAVINAKLGRKEGVAAK